jgi:S1-C subfamily serine protease
MKKYLPFVVSGVVGGLACAVILNLFPAKSDFHIQKDPRPEAIQVSQSSNNVVNTGPSFVLAARVSTPAVVHIYAEESNQSVQERLRKSRRQNQMGYMSMEDFFGGDFFGRNYYKQSGSGSGVIYSKDGFIITNNHVVEFADILTVTTENGKKYKATKVGTDPASDLAVIKIEGNDFKPIEFGDSDKLQVGEWVLAVGNPFDYLTSTVTAGIVSAKGRSLDIIKDEKAIEEFIQTDAAVNPGNSGGALVDAYGKLVGINTAIATPTGVYAGYSFAIPANLVKPRIENIIKFGNTEQVSLGVGGYDLDQSLIGDYSLKTSAGFYVDQVQKSSPAKLAGILPGDVIVKMGKKKVAAYSDIESFMTMAKKGSEVPISVNRGGKEIELMVYFK